MAKHVSGNPVQPDNSQRAAQWMMAMLVLLFSLTILCHSTLTHVVHQWHQTLSQRLKIEIPEKLTLPQVFDVLSHTPAVERFQVVQEQALSKDETPWIPSIIDVVLKPSVNLDLMMLAKNLHDASPRSRVETFDNWLVHISRLQFYLESLSLIVLAILGVTVLGTITLVARSGLVIHHEIVDTLQLMGATSRYIARQFEIQAFRLSLKGGTLGLIFLLPLVYGLGVLLDHWHLSSQVHFLPHPSVIVGLVTLPLVVAIISMMVARLSILHGLAKQV